MKKIKKIAIEKFNILTASEESQLLGGYCGDGKNFSGEISYGDEHAPNAGGSLSYTYNGFTATGIYNGQTGQTSLSLGYKFDSPTISFSLSKLQSKVTQSVSYNVGGGYSITGAATSNSGGYNFAVSYKDNGKNTNCNIKLQYDTKTGLLFGLTITF